MSKSIPQMKFSALVVAFAAILFAVGCSGPPSESVGRTILERHIASQSGGKIKLVSFRKTNATGSDSHHSLEWTADIEFLASGSWESGSSMDSVPQFAFSTSQVGGGGIAGLMGSLVGAKNVQQGQRTTVKGVFTFQKTERGWRGPDGNVY